MIERYQLRYFLAVVEAGTFSRAARQVNVTQPTLSTGIAKMERALGGPLFVRNSKRVHLTPLGAQALPHARAIEREFSGFEEAGSPGPFTGPVRLGVLTTIPTRIVEKVVRLHRNLADGDHLEIIEGAEGDLISRLDRKRIDLAMTVVRAGQSRFRAEAVTSEGYVLAVGQDHPLAAQSFVEADRLAAEVMLVRRSCELLRETSRYFTERGVRPRFSFRTHNDERAAAMVRAGLGITVAPESWREPGVALVRLTGFNHRRDLGLLYGEGWPEARSSGGVTVAVRRALAEEAAAQTGGCA